MLADSMPCSILCFMLCLVMFWRAFLFLKLSFDLKDAWPILDHEAACPEGLSNPGTPPPPNMGGTLRTLKGHAFLGFCKWHSSVISLVAPCAGCKCWHQGQLGRTASRSSWRAGWKRVEAVFCLGQRVACFLPGYLVSIAGFGKPKKKCLSIAPALKTSSGSLGARFRSCEAANHLVVFCQSGETCGEFTKIPWTRSFSSRPSHTLACGSHRFGVLRTIPLDARHTLFCCGTYPFPPPPPQKASQNSLMTFSGFHIRTLPGGVPLVHSPEAH